MQVRITDDTGSERATVPLVSAEIERTGLYENARARIVIARDDLNGIATLASGEDRVYIEDGGTDRFGGILKTPGRAGARPELLVDSFAVLMDRAQPTPLGERSVGVDDSTLIQECIDATPGLTAGTIQTVASGLTWITSGVSQLAKARKVAEAAGGELVFRPDRTVDYLAQRGADKTGTTLSPANQSFAEDTFIADTDGVSGNATHLAVYGVGQGTAQISAVIIPADDTGTYPDFDLTRTYTNSDWSDGDPKRWASQTNKDLKTASVLATWGESLIEDYQTAETTAETVVKGADVALGDRYHIQHPEESIDQDLRATSVTALLGAEGGTRYETTFSNYDRGSVDLSAEQYKDVGRYNQAFEGDLTQIQQGPGRGPVGPNNDYLIHVYYPDDVVAEVNAQVLVKGTHYRAFSNGTGAVPGQSDSVFVSEGGDAGIGNLTLDQISSDHTINTRQWPYIIHAGAIERVNNTDRVRLLDLYLYDDQGNSWTIAQGPQTQGEETAGQVSAVTPIYEDLSGRTVDLRAYVQTQSGNGTVLSYSLYITGIPPHGHAADPGLIDFDGIDASPAHYPDNVDVAVNGTSQGTSLGDGTGEFEATVDVGGALSAGWNTIRLSSDTLGHLDATFSADLFRQSL